MKIKAIKLFLVLEFIWFHKSKQNKYIYIYVLTGTITANPYSEFFLYLPILRECERGRFIPGLSYSSLTGQEVFFLYCCTKSQLEPYLRVAHSTRAFELALFAARIFLLNLIQIFYEKLSLPF